MTETVCATAPPAGAYGRQPAFTSLTVAPLRALRSVCAFSACLRQLPSADRLCLSVSLRLTRGFAAEGACGALGAVRPPQKRTQKGPPIVGRQRRWTPKKGPKIPQNGQKSGKLVEIHVLGGEKWQNRKNGTLKPAAKMPKIGFSKNRGFRTSGGSGGPKMGGLGGPNDGVLVGKGGSPRGVQKGAKKGGLEAKIGGSGGSRRGSGGPKKGVRGVKRGSGGPKKGVRGVPESGGVPKWGSRGVPKSGGGPKRGSRGCQKGGFWGQNRGFKKIGETPGLASKGGSKRGPKTAKNAPKMAKIAQNGPKSRFFEKN